MQIFIHNKYRKIYIQVIKKAKTENRVKLPKDHPDYIYYENHHIFPKCDSMFPKYKNLTKHSWNGVLLTAKEHYFVHRLLTKFTKGEALRSMKLSVFRTIHGLQKQGHYIPCSRVFSIICREKSYQGHSEETKRKISAAQIGKKRKPHLEETKRKISAAQIGKNNSMFGKKHTTKTRFEMSKNRTGKNNFMFGKTHSEKTRKKMSNAAKKRKRLPEGFN